MNRNLLPGLVLIAACGGGGDDPDAPPTTSDGPAAADARPVDAAPLPPDADLACAADQICLRITPVDGVTTLPPGRIAVAWVPTPDSPDQVLEIGYDEVWTGAEVTRIDLSTITPPSAAYQSADLDEICPGALFGRSLIVVSTDPDGDGAVTSQEISDGLGDGTIYGVEQEIVAYFSIACAAMPPDFPDGFLAGVHHYSEEQPVMNLDGEITELQTCAPETAACAQLEPPG